MNQHWSNISERGNLFGIRILLFCYKLSGRWFAWLILGPVILYFFITGREARRASGQFLYRVWQAHPDGPIKQKPGIWHSFTHFLSFGCAALDKVDSWLGKISSQQLSYTNYALFAKLRKNQQGAVFIGSHLGNLEVCRALSSQKYPVRINVLVFTQHAQAFNTMLKQLNVQVGVNLIQVNELGPDVAIMLKQRIDDGEYLVIVGDRTPIANPGRVANCQFLQHGAPFSQGPLILASLLECPVYLLFCLRQRSGFHIILESFCESKLVLKRNVRQQRLNELCQIYADRLAYYAVRYPLQWFNFYDFWQHEFASAKQEDSTE